MNAIERIFRESSTSAQFTDAYIAYITSILGQLDRSAIGLFADSLLYARRQGSKIFFIGNGGSASTASHFANDILFGTKSLTPPFKAISLCDNLAVLTAVANDYGYDKIFSVQLQALLKPGDVVVAISASGNSKNILEAIQYANANDAVTVGLTGFDGGALKNLVKIHVHVPTQKGEYGPAEDLHLIINHVVASYLMQVIRNETSLKPNIRAKSA